MTTRLAVAFTSLCTAIALAGPQARAEVVSRYDDKTATLSEVDPSTKVGDAFFAVDATGVRRALLKITSIEGGHAKAEVVRGALAPGLKVIKRPPPTRTVFLRVGAGGSFFAARIPEVTTKGRLGITGEAIVSWVPGTFGIETGLMYYQAGYRYYEEGILDISVDVDYVGVPLVVRYSFADEAPFGTNLKIGALYSRLVKSKMGGTILGRGVDQDGVTPDSHNDVLLLAGFDYQTKNYFVDVSYAFGLTEQHGYTDTDFVNSGAFLLFGVPF